MCNFENTLVSLQDLNIFTGNYEDSEDAKHLKYQILQSATEVVEEYLNYHLTSGIHIDNHVGFNNSMIFLYNKPVTMVSSVTVDGEDFEDFGFDFESIYRTDGNTFKDNSKIVIEYETNVVGVPPLIKTTILRIASLMLTEADGNIGITGKTAPDGMSRTFLNYTSYEKYLKPLTSYRVFKI